MTRPADESERRLAEALRAMATGAGRPNSTLPGAAAPAGSRRRRDPGGGTGTALLLALLAGALLGTVLALLSLLAPGLLPPLG